MPPRTHSETRNLVACALCEIIDSVVTPRVRDGILAQALEGFRAEQLPTDPNRLQDFVTGPLREALARTIGPEPVEAMVSDLQRVIDMLLGSTPSLEQRQQPSAFVHDAPHRRSSSRPRMPAVSSSQRSTPIPHHHSTPPRASFRTAPTPRYPSWFPPAAKPISSGRFPRGAAAALSMAGTYSSKPPAESSQPIVFVASHRQDLARSLSLSLASHVQIVILRNMLELVREFGIAPEGRCVLLIDCQNPSLKPMSVAALADDLPDSLQVVLWGITPELRTRLAAISPRCRTWIGIDRETPVDELAGRCTVLVC